MKQNNLKTTYTSPEVELLVVQNEGIVCASLTYGGEGAAGGEQSYNNYASDF